MFAGPAAASVLGRLVDGRKSSDAGLERRRASRPPHAMNTLGAGARPGPGPPSAAATSSVSSITRWRREDARLAAGTTILSSGPRPRRGEERPARERQSSAAVSSVLGRAPRAARAAGTPAAHAGRPLSAFSRRRSKRAASSITASTRSKAASAAAVVRAPSETLAKRWLSQMGPRVAQGRPR